MHIKAKGSLKGFIFHNGNPLGGQMLAQGLQIVDMKGGMRLFGGSEVLLNADMQFMHAAPEPDTPAFCQIVGLRNFLHPQNFSEKPAGLLFTALRRGQLDVINARKLKCHGILIPPNRISGSCGDRMRDAPQADNPPDPNAPRFRSGHAPSTVPVYGGRPDSAPKRDAPLPFQSVPFLAAHISREIRTKATKAKKGMVIK